MDVGLGWFGCWWLIKTSVIEGALLGWTGLDGWMDGGWVRGCESPTALLGCSAALYVLCLVPLRAVRLVLRCREPTLYVRACTPAASLFPLRNSLDRFLGILISLGTPSGPGLNRRCSICFLGVRSSSTSPPALATPCPFSPKHQSFYSILIVRIYLVLGFPLHHVGCLEASAFY